MIAEKCGRPPEFLHIEDRPVNDQAYAMEPPTGALGWRQESSLGGEIDKMIALHPHAAGGDRLRLCRRTGFSSAMSGKSVSCAPPRAAGAELIDAGDGGGAVLRRRGTD